MDYQNQYTPPPDTSQDLFQDEPLVYAGFWERFGAAFIDGLVIGVPNYFISEALGPESTEALLISIVIPWLYSALQESGPAMATVGKRAVGIKVVNQQGARISFGQATGRHFGKYLSMLLLLIGYLMMLWDEKKQTLHDKMAGTFVVKK